MFEFILNFLNLYEKFLFKTLNLIFADLYD